MALTLPPRPSLPVCQRGEVCLHGKALFLVARINGSLARFTCDAPPPGASTDLYATSLLHRFT
eukprot:840177-Prymnesium_polylepis.1